MQINFTSYRPQQGIGYPGSRDPGVVGHSRLGRLFRGVWYLGGASVSWGEGVGYPGGGGYTLPPPPPPPEITKSGGTHPTGMLCSK